jgi:hypothetical protein
MNIKFSHNYNKLYNSAHSIKLLEVININIENLSKEFLEYDTDNGKYKLPEKGKFMILIFKKNMTDIFTTIRRWTSEKEKYYHDAIGKWFSVIIEKE